MTLTNNQWIYKYIPNSFKEMVLNEKIRPKLEKAIKDVPNLMLFGTAGVGKGTFVNVLLKETGMDYMWINASDETGVDVIRDKVTHFATSLGVTEMKLVIFNEASALSSGASGAQKILKELIETTHKITRYIFMFNEEHLIIPELKSRCQVIKLDSPPGAEIYKYVKKILDTEKVKYSPKMVANIIKKCYPDIRKTVMTLQENTIKGKLIGDMISTSEEVWQEILNQIISMDMEGLRKNLRSNFIAYTELYAFLYENIGTFKTPGEAIIEIADHLRWHNDVANKEINFMHMVMKMAKSGVI